ncbi:MAG: cysteine desulfurase [Planctomycetes bacterium]|nr:cysteine desulfurase [Planctomycetota bacterium]
MATATKTKSTYDIARIRRDFPILSRTVNNRPLVYLDNGASAQKPQVVIDALSKFYSHDYANIHRAVHELSQQATEAYEEARRKVQAFLNAPEAREIIFTRGTTEAINLIAFSWGRANVKAGDEILITAMEHHSNIVPWQMLCEATGAKLRVGPIDDAGELIYDDWAKLLTKKTKLVGIVHVSNALGTINPVKKMIDAAHKVGAKVLIDGAQAVPHLRVDVQALDCDFYAFSGHKVYGPSGVGALYGKAALLEAMPPWQGGGDMIKSVCFDKTEYAEIPAKFEAGTPSIADGIALGVALDYVTGVGLDNIAAHENDLLQYATEKVSAIKGVRLIGTAREKAGVLSFILDGIHATDAGVILDQSGIAIRSGHHCAQPVMDRYKVPATIRASFGMYNTREEVDALVKGVLKVQELFA